MDLLEHKKRISREMKQEQVNWEESKETVQAAMDQDRKAKAQVELNLARNKKGKKNHLNGLTDNIVWRELNCKFFNTPPFILKQVLLLVISAEIY